MVVMMAPKQRLMTIGQVARTAGVAATTLRYYEREGILPPTARNGVGYRLYDAQAVERLQFLRSAQAVGFTLDDIRTLLQLDEKDNKSCQAEVQPLLERRLAEVDEKMKELRRVRETLGRALDRCRRSSGECAVLKDLRPKRK
jgi:MerR family mercuric resistance operon transcriptional regulator